MLTTSFGYKGAFTAPHRIAALAGQKVLAEGGTAIEAMVSAAATIAVVYPHMNGMGGDGFWLVRQKGQRPVGISACGRAAMRATPHWYHDRNCSVIPPRGALAAVTVPGTIAGWAKALDLVPEGRRLPLSRLLAPAIDYAAEGIAVSQNQAVTTAAKADELKDVDGFADIYLPGGALPAAGSRLRQEALASTLRHLAQHGLDSFYRGAIAEANARFLEQAGSPLQLADFNRFDAERVEPLSVTTRWGRLFNMTPPTQGVSALMILALYDRLLQDEACCSADHIHLLVEATKQAFILRNSGLGDPDHMADAASNWLAPDRLDALARRVDRGQALAWPHVAKPGDTIWMGAADSEGTVVSFIQSVFWEFGSGLTSPQTGIQFQNRGSAFSLNPGPNQLRPGARPFHTLNPAMAELRDGRLMAYGTMGGEGQPQTQAAVFTRHVHHGMPLQAAITAPRWLLGRTWGEDSTTLKLEGRFDMQTVEALRQRGHATELLADFSDAMGHAGAAILHPDGLIEAATDPRSDGAALAF